MSLITPDLGIIFWQTLTFLAVLSILARYAWRPLLHIIKEREQAVAHAINQVAEAQALMEQVVHDRSKLLQEADLERERMMEVALEVKKEIIERAYQEAGSLKEHLLSEARASIAQEEERALTTVKRQLGFLAIQIAEKLLMKELNKEQSQVELIEHLTTTQQSATS